MPPRRARPARDAEHARQALLDAALVRFSRHGYRGTRLADVAKDAGYSEALVYHHFHTKQELFRAVVSGLDAQTRWFDDDATPDALVAHLRDGELRYHRDARWRALDPVWAEALGGEKDLLELLRPQVRAAVAGLDGVLARFDQVHHPARRQLVLLLLAVSYGARVLRRYDPDFLSPEEAADLIALGAEAALAALDGRLPARDVPVSPPPEETP